MIKPRIDTLTPGDTVRLLYAGSATFGNGPHEGEAVFLGISGAGDARRATFRDTTGRQITWEAYRYNGHWAYGSSAEPLRLLEVLTSDRSLATL